MIAFLKRNIFVVVIFFITFILGFITFLTFIEKSFINISDKNLKYLLFIDIFLLLLFFLLIFLEIKNSLKQNINVEDLFQIESIFYFSPFYSYSINFYIYILIISFLFCTRKIL